MQEKMKNEIKDAKKLGKDILKTDDPAKPSRLWRSNKYWMPVSSLRVSSKVTSEMHRNSLSCFGCHDRISSDHILKGIDGGFSVPPHFAAQLP